MKNKKKLQNCNKDYKYLNQIGINFESTQNSNHRTQKPNLKPIAISNQQFILSFNEIKIRSFSSYPKGINQRNNFSSILSKKNLDKKLPMANKDFSRFINYAETKKKNHLSNGLVIITQILLIFFFFSFILLGIKSIGPLIVESITGFGKWLLTFFIPVAIIVSSLSVILVTNPIYGLIGLILVFLNTAIFLISIQIQFLAFIYLIVYIGAIAILFLFVIMLFNLKSLQKNKGYLERIPFLETSLLTYLLLGIKFLMVFSIEIKNFIENSGYNYYALINQFNIQYQVNYVHLDISLFSNLFYTYYRYIFLLAGLLLLVSMIGSIILALSTHSIKGNT